MLTKDIRKTIDNARDVLVGKIPNPQSQIEQITIAMIYKFMDDMDLEAVEFGGERQFFTGELEEFAWSKLMSPQLGAEARMNLYTEALDKLPLEQSIPKLFRDIFKGAYLPFRDAQTLNLFLKEINDLSYDNSENLGNAFEYLLSIMGSQGDAGQFRTPRHIIDFIVKLVKPTKNDTILDPACGTAGFLISAYKYIDKQAKETNQLLTPDELKGLAENIQGYDISPDMVKLALVNMYLHKFKEPKIYEYDTLTKLDRWDNYFDCILANPPFMTPKGGIQPHNRFGVKANRSEVLFVDYIMEHLNSTGRAGIIVPEGIVFQSANAYKELRKKLVEENILYAVISLPSGVFQPYSGVKTSILLLDKQLAKKTDKILFVEIQNDGFDLGAQRREIDKNDLPEAVEIINQWQNQISHPLLEERDGVRYQPENILKTSKLVTIVEKSKLAENGEYNLTASRYKVTQDFSNCKWDMVKLEDVCDLQNGFAFKSADYVEQSNTLNIRMSNIRPNKTFDSTYNLKYLPDEFAKKYSDFLLNSGDVIIAMTDMATETKILGVPTFVEKEPDKNYLMNQRVCRFTDIDEKILSKKYLSYVLQNPDIINNYKNYGNGGLQINISKKDILNQEIPLPPLEVQEEIVKELDGYQAVIDGAQKVIDNWKPTLPINPNWEKVKLGDICEVQSGGTPSKPKKEYWENGSIKWLGSTVCKDVRLTNEVTDYITEIGLQNSSAKIFKENTTLVALVGATIGKTALLTYEATTNQNIAGIYPKDTTAVNPIYLFYAMQTLYNEFIKVGNGDFKMANLSFIKSLTIYKPTASEQQMIVAKIEEEEKAIEECKKLIEIHKQKINDKIQSIWGNE